MNEVKNADLKNLTDEQKQDILKEVNTEVVSIAEEERKTGKKIALPSAEELVSRAGSSIIQAQRSLSQLVPTMSKKQILRSLHAVFAPPQADMPVYLKTDEEKMFFDIGQKVFMSKHVIFQHHVLQEQRRITEELKKQKETKEVTNQKEETNESTEQSNQA